MGNLTIWSATNELASAINAIVTTYRTFRVINRHESAILQEKIRVLQTMARIQGMGEIARSMIEEISKTQAFINQQNLSSNALWHSMGILERLGEQLKQEMEGNRNGIF